MKIIRNEKLIKRNSKIGQYAMWAGIVIVFGTVYFAIQFMRNPAMATATSQTVLLVVLFVSIIVSQVSMYFGGRWGRSPRPDEQIDAALKGIPGDYTMYHYLTPASHLLIGPAGVWVMMPYNQRGKITYQKNRWKNSGGGFVQGYMRIFGQESIGRPDLEVSSEVAGLEKFLKKKLTGEESLPPIQAALVFFNPQVEIEADDAPIPTMPAKKLKELIRKSAKEKPLDTVTLEKLKSALAPA